MASSDVNTKAFGKAFSFHLVDYQGDVASTFQVDASARTVATIWPASGPSASLGSASAGLKTVTLAAGGAQLAGKVIVVVGHGAGVIPSGYIGNHA